MVGGQVIARARRRSRLSQDELAHRIGTTKSAISRWEHGRVEPSFRSVEEAVRTCGLELSSLLAEPDPDPHDLSLLETSLSLSVSERLQRLIDFTNFVEVARR